MNYNDININKRLHEYYNTALHSKMNAYITENTINHSFGFIELYVFKNRGKDAVPDAVVTIYARQGDDYAIPVKKLITTTNPITFDLPVAHPYGTLIKGPEYYFTTYNMTIEGKDYFKITVLNIRIFPGVKINFDYNLNEKQAGLQHQDEIYYIPQHPRDVINQKYLT